MNLWVPTITENLLNKALDFASNFIDITDEDRHIILQAKKSILYSNSTSWSKKDSTFDVTMDSFDGAETCELVGLYILSQMQDLGINVGLYRDDGLAVSDKTPKETETTKKRICKIFEKNNLKITIEANLKNVNFLDINLDLRSEIYKPYAKPNNTPLYVHRRSNHPPSIIKNIPISINRRINSISANEQVFKQAAPEYQQALNVSGYKYNLEYQDIRMGATNSMKRKRKITWFNPPFSQNVQTNVAKCFLKIIDKCFPADHKLHKIINRNTIKVSYSCMRNLKSIISQHNKNTIQQHEENKTHPQRDSIAPTTDCNCRDKANCPVGGKCLEKKYYISGHRQSNKHQQRRNIHWISIHHLQRKIQKPHSQF